MAYSRGLDGAALVLEAWLPSVPGGYEAPRTKLDDGLAMAVLGTRGLQCGSEM